MTEAERKLRKARTDLILRHPFFGCIAMKLKLVEINFIPTAATDGVDLFYNPLWIESLSQAKVLGLMAHEIMHIALGHIWRVGTRDKKLWNEAADYAINGLLDSYKFSLPNGALTNHQYDNKCAEEIYKLLKQQTQQTQQNQQGQNNQASSGQDQGDKRFKGFADPGGNGGVIEYPSHDENGQKTDITEAEANWKASLAQAVQVAQGDLPENLKRLVSECINPAVPWRVLLRDFVEMSARNDYNWTRANRRHLQRGFILPSLLSEELPEVVIAIDTSGSIDKKMLDEFISEANEVLGSYDTTIRVIYCDAKVHKEDVFTRIDRPIKANPIGGGGTDFRPAFDYINKQGYIPSCLIYFTDLYGTFPKEEPEYPVMWLTKTRNKDVPFGKVVEFRGD